MGSRGSFLESGGFSTPTRWQTVDYVDGIKVLELKDAKSSRSLPEGQIHRGHLIYFIEKMAISTTSSFWRKSNA